MERPIALGRARRWLALAGIIIASRLVSTGMLLWFANGQAENPWTAENPDLFEFSRIWDSHWYRIIAETGYPAELPIDDDGRVGENAWAFMPVYPLIVRGLMAMTDAPFAIVSVVVSTVAFALFIVVADRFFRRIIGDSASLAALAVIAFAPVAPVYQVGYAESLGMLFLAVVMVGLTERRWWLAALFIPLAALTRPVGVPLTLTIAIMAVMAWRGRSDRGPLAGLVVLAGLSAVAWPAIAWGVTGRPTAYIETEVAWRRPYIGNNGHGWGTGWWDSAVWWFHDDAPWVIGGLALFFVIVALLPATRRLGVVALAWTGSYVVYLVMVLFPQSSIFRLFIPLFPLAGVVARNRTFSIVAVAVGIVGQFFWVKWCWSVEGSDWTPP
ncbi:unannotated protein [freshwater metagenome]|uniref:Unannotated protein n=1 Tax=freshwater metagenome TaxID=449393 RepID=A0A6J7D5C2_9ZZZZ|nr:hypothetical protein [Actinomycetota bacterium]